MKKKKLSLWLDALRSNQYIQTKYALKNNEGFCPFGVLCDISGLGSWEPEPKSSKYQYLNQINYLPKQVREWAGISDKEFGDLTAFIITYNDTVGLSFLEMAEVLSKKYKLEDLNESSFDS